MVEQFNNFKGTKQAEVQHETTRSVEITAPILDYQPPGVTGGQLPNPPKQRSQSPEKESEQNTWKNNPIFASSEEETLDDDDDDDDDVPEIIKRLSQNGLPAGKQLSDTLSSDMIVNSISNGTIEHSPTHTLC